MRALRPGQVPGTAGTGRCDTQLCRLRSGDGGTGRVRTRRGAGLHAPVARLRAVPCRSHGAAGAAGLPGRQGGVLGHLRPGVRRAPPRRPGVSADAGRPGAAARPGNPARDNGVRDQHRWPARRDAARRPRAALHHRAGPRPRRAARRHPAGGHPGRRTHDGLGLRRHPAAAGHATRRVHGLRDHPPRHRPRPQRLHPALGDRAAAGRNAARWRTTPA